jgi:LuxR family maltose regulon positive regulatory protein
MKREESERRPATTAFSTGRTSGAARGRPGSLSAPLPFIAAKLSRPQMLRARVRRQRLIEQFDAATRRPVTLVSAGAGWGKTVLASTWAETRQLPIGWVNLDAEDNHAQIFWSYVIAALRAAGAVPADNPLAHLQAVPDDDVERIHHLARGFSRLRTPTVLVLDDFQEIDDPVVIRELTALIRHSLPRLRLVLLTRTEPALQLHRLRATGELAEIRAADLAFTAVEAADLLAQQEPALSGEDVTELLERTEGWPAGLQLATAFLGASGGPHLIADFSGDLRSVDEFLANEVLAGQPPQLRLFLLTTSICEHICGDLADAVTQHVDGQRTLDELERSSDFVVRLGARPQWYRYHHLMRDVLRHRLRLESPELVPELHRRAARWYAAHHSVIEALRHAVTAEDWPYVAELVIRQAAPLILSANRSVLMKLLVRVPTSELSSTAELMVCGALMLFHAGAYDAIPERLAGARALLSGRSEADALPVEITIDVLQASVHRAVGDMPALIEEATQLLARIAKVRFAEVPSVLQYRAIALLNKGVGLLWTGRTDAADRYLWAARTAGRAAGVGLVEIDALGHLALLEAMRGSVKEAARLATDGVELAGRLGLLNALQAVAAHLAIVLVRVEHHDADAAQRALHRALRDHRSEPEPAQRMVLSGVETRLALAQGEPQRARALLERARYRPDPRVRAAALDDWLRLAESETDLETGRPDLVEARYARAASEGPLNSAEQVCRARAAFALDDPDRAERLLPTEVTLASETVATVQHSILAALIADVRGHALQATDALGRALALADAEGIRSPFIAMDSGRLSRLVGRQNLLVHRNAPFAAEILQAMTSAARGTHPASSAGGTLSERETEVLQYLPTMLTAGEIADELGVSVNTVKAHLRAIYRKLDAARRREAVARAQEEGLL